jgi:hypothetical protein
LEKTMAMRARLRRVGTTRPVSKLGEEAGGEAGVAAELDQAHGFLEAEVLDALADALLRDDGLGADPEFGPSVR